MNAVPGVVFLAALIVGGCAIGGSSPGGPTLTVFAAASLGSALDEIAAVYEAETGASIVVATDASAALATQIEQGAPADIFLSADTGNPQRLAQAGLTDGDPVVFARNGLAVIVPVGNPAAIRSPADLGRPGVRIVAAGEAVPVTAYAATFLQRLVASGSAPPSLPGAYAANIVSMEDNVSAVVAKIALGEGDAAIVYATDALASDGVQTVVLPSGTSVTAAYAAAIVAASVSPAEARSFLDWLLGPRGQAVLGRYGFQAGTP